MAKKITIYTDGSCIGNPGPGGWAAIILLENEEIALSGSTSATTNNRMEMTAMIGALHWLRTKSGLPADELPACDITLYSDSNLIVQTLTKGWKRKANTDLWAKIDALRAWLNIRFVWVKAHANNGYNNKVDALALAAAKRAR